MAIPIVNYVIRQIAKKPAPLRVLAFLLLLLLLWAPLALPLAGLIDDPDHRSIVTLVVLYGEFIWLASRWARVAHGEPQPLVRYGLLRSRNPSLLLLGLGLGLGLIFALFALESLLGWALWRSPGADFWQIALEGLLVGLAIGFAEELLFRGWMLDELGRDYPWQTALGANAVVFALLHFLKPWEEIVRTWPQFWGLVLLGISLALAKRATGERLGLAMGLHGGLVCGYYWINVGQLIEITGLVPDWVTGIDQNPLAGWVGLAFLTGLAIALATYTHQKFGLDRGR